MARKRARKEQPTPKVRSPRRWKLDRLEVALAAFALLLRLPHLGWGLPEVEEEALPMKQALAMWGWNDGRTSFDPGVAGWPSLSFYIQLLLQHLHYWIGRLTGAFANRDDYFVSYWLDNGPVLLLARAASLVATVGIVWCATRLARNMAGREAAVLVGATLALSPLLIAYAQLVTPDVWVALFAALAVSRIVAIQSRGRAADYVWAGLWIGLGISTKYTPVLLLPALFVAHALRETEVAQPTQGRRLRALVARAPWLGVAVAVLAFVLTSPYLFLNPSVLVRDVPRQVFHMAAGHFGASARPAVIEYLVGTLAPALSWPGLVLSLAGLAWACVRAGGPWLALAACVLPYYLGLSLPRTQFPRYVLPLLMPIAMGLAGLVSMLRRTRMPPAQMRLVVAGLGLVVVSGLAWGAWRYHVEKSRPSAAHLADQMFRQDPALRPSRIASEMLGLSLPTMRTLSNFPPGLVARLTPEQRRRILQRPVFDVEFIPMYSVQPELSAFYYDLRHYVDYDYIVISQSVRDRYLQDSARFAQQAAFYRDLDRHAQLVQAYRVPTARPPEIFVYHLSPESASVLMRSRGPRPLDPAHLPPSLDPDFMIFIEGVARAAYARGDWLTALRYYRTMFEVAPQSGMPPDQREALGRMIAELEARAGSAAAGR